MIFRFSLYGFLKNQRYFEPFLVLILLEKGMSFFTIGLLIAFREITVNLFEVPSGAVADVCGRRTSMIFSFAAYVVSFIVFGLATHVALLFLAMFLFAVGEAFRTGTHKAMIFTWLRLNDRIDQRTRVYGFTRSWSQIGSAVSVVLAAVFVFASNSYTYVFYFAVVPYLLNIVNFLGYPKELEGRGSEPVSLARVLRHTRDTVVAAITRPGLRRLVIESMGFEGVFQAAKDYLQPALKHAALAAGATLALTAGLSDAQQGALLVGPVYFVLYLLSAWGSRRAHRLTDAAGGEERGARLLWIGNGTLYAGLIVAAYFRVSPLVIAIFVALHVLQSVWRPVLISRFDTHSDESQGATVLSIESQAQSVATMVIAPLLGLAVDAVSAHGPGGPFWPVGVCGVLATLAVFGTAMRGAARPRAAAALAAPDQHGHE